MPDGWQEGTWGRFQLFDCGGSRFSGLPRMASGLGRIHKYVCSTLSYSTHRNLRGTAGFSRQRDRRLSEAVQRRFRWNQFSSTLGKCSLRCISSPNQLWTFTCTPANSMRKAYKFRIYPTGNQADLLDHELAAA